MTGPAGIPAGTESHRQEAKRFTAIRCGVLTVSDSRTTETDESGRYLREALVAAGHPVHAADLLPNDEVRVRTTLVEWLGRGDLDLIVITGGTGLGSRDRTVEVVRPLLEKEMPGFGELFRMLSYQEQIGTASILSRATAGSAGGKLLISLPGSRAACQLAMERIILPEGAHALRELRR